MTVVARPKSGGGESDFVERTVVELHGPTLVVTSPRQGAKGARITVRARTGSGDVRLFRAA